MSSAAKLVDIDQILYIENNVEVIMVQLKSSLRICQSIDLERLKLFFRGVRGDYIPVEYKLDDLEESRKDYIDITDQGI